MKLKKWNGWGWQESGFEPRSDYPHLIPLLEKLLKEPLKPTAPPKPAEQVGVTKSRLSKSLLKEFYKIIPAKRLLMDNSERLFHARGRSLPDLLSLRSGEIDEFPDAVAYPQSNEEVCKILKLAERRQIAVIPFGGGSSVVGGVNAKKAKSHKAILSLNLSKMNRLLSIDPASQTARFQCGIFGPELEDTLNRHGFTLGHFPQSFEFSTLGGWIATRGAGYLSDFYGKIEDMVVSLCVCLPGLLLNTEDSPEISEGPLLSEVFSGSEGTLGVITEASVKIRPLPAAKKYQSFIFSNFSDACRLLQSCCRQNISHSMIRISDPQETRYFQDLKPPALWKKRLRNFLLKILGYNSPTLVLVITEGKDASRNLGKIKRLAKKGKSIRLGAGAVLSWFDSRYKTPYLRDYLLGFGIVSETFESWVSWGQLEALRNGVYELFLRQEARKKKKYVIMAHISHASAQGVCIYFTLLYRFEKNKTISEWAEIKSQVTATILKNGGSVSHHHGLGSDHRAFMEKGARGIKLGILEKLKKNLDPENILNPGKIF